MTRHLQGVGASPGRTYGEARRFEWDVPRVEHRTIEPDEVEDEVQRFQDARAAAREDIRELREQTADRLGKIEAQIFDPQILMLDDPDLVDGTLSYIRDNFLSAERAFDWRVLETRSQILDAGHAMVMDRLADLEDVRVRVLSHLLDRNVDPQFGEDGEDRILTASELTPGCAVQLDSERVEGILTAAGSRSSHSAVLARSLGIPAVVGVGPELEEIEDGTPVIVDGHVGRVVVDPSQDDLETFRRAVESTGRTEERLQEIVDAPGETADGVEVALQANLDQPHDTEEAVRVGAQGVGLFRSEFLVIGHRTVPTEEEQYEAYREVVSAFPDQPVNLRTFDIGGDKFPMFLQAPPEENPFLGWRAIRVCLDRPDLFRRQLRAALRAGAHGRMRLMLPFVVSVSEIRRTKEHLREVIDELEVDGEVRDVPLGVMVETPAAVETIDLMTPHVDFLSLGTNDLTQYTLAADRGNAKLSGIFDPLHPALVRSYSRLRRQAERDDCELSVCGELASDPVGVAVLLGLGYRQFSVPPSTLPELKEVIRSVEVSELEQMTSPLADRETAGEIRAPFERYLESVSSLPQAPTARLSQE